MNNGSGMGYLDGSGCAQHSCDTEIGSGKGAGIYCEGDNIGNGYGNGCTDGYGYGSDGHGSGIGTGSGSYYNDGYGHGLELERVVRLGQRGHETAIGIGEY
jgi:hypothetical protein